jgi:hypothetical protein
MTNQGVPARGGIVAVRGMASGFAQTVETRSHVPSTGRWSRRLISAHRERGRTFVTAIERSMLHHARRDNSCAMPHSL